MDTTPVSLLERLRQPDQPEAWARLVSLVTPLLYFWAHRVGLRGEEAGELVQEVFVVLLERLPTFSYDPQKSFRGWLRTVTLNLWRARQRRQPARSLEGDPRLYEGLAAPDEADPFWEVEYREHLVGRALELMQSEFEPTTWKACWEHVVSGRTAAEVGAQLGLSEGAVYAARSRVLRRLRGELAGLLE